MIGAGQHIVIAGAGSVGCYVGGCLALAGRKVTLLARPRIERALRDGGLRVSDLDGRDRLADADAIAASTDPAVLTGADIVLVTVKSVATEDRARLIAKHARADATVVSLQNGIDNAARLKALVAGRPVLAGMVPFNVVQPADGEQPLHVHRASEGTVLVQVGMPGLAELLSVEGCAVAAHPDIQGVLWGKLLFNLNNALVALSDLPLAQELAERRWRLVLARQIREALAAMKAGGIRPVAAAGSAPPALLPFSACPIGCSAGWRGGCWRSIRRLAPPCGTIFSTAVRPRSKPCKEPSSTWPNEPAPPHRPSNVPSRSSARPNGPERDRRNSGPMRSPDGQAGALVRDP